MSTILNEIFQSPRLAAEVEQSNLPVAFVFADNAAALRQWAVKSENFFHSQQQKIEHLNKALNSVDLLATGKTRLEALRAAEIKRTEEFRQLLTDFQFKNNTVDPKEAVKHRIPSRQHFESYQKNIFRDWNWGHLENEIYKNHLSQLSNTDGYALIVGGGAGRLLYDLSMLFPQLNIVQLDINPLLSLVGQKMCRGETLELTELSPFYISQKNMLASHVLKAPAPLPVERFKFLVGDIGAHPFRDQIFDLVVCPWLIDIIGENFSSFAKRLNFLLKPEAELCLFGPLSFEKQSALNRFSSEEVHECLLASGFSNISYEEKFIPYLQSPLDVQKREEKIIFLRCKKSKVTKKPKPFSPYPAWLTDINLKAPTDSTALLTLQSQKNLEAQFLAGLLSGKSIHEMAVILTQSGTGLNLEQAENFVVSVFARLYEAGDISNDAD